MRSFIIGLGFTVNQRTWTYRTYFHKFGIFLDFNSPTLVFSQMPMKIIDIVQCQHINDLFQIRNREIMAAHVYHKTAITETRIVINSSHRDGSGYLFVFGQWQSLIERLHSIKDPRLTSSIQMNVFRSYLQLIPLFVGNGTVNRQDYGILLCGFSCCPDGNSRSLFNIGS